MSIIEDSIFEDIQSEYNCIHKITHVSLKILLDKQDGYILFEDVNGKQHTYFHTEIIFPVNSKKDI